MPAPESHIDSDATLAEVRQELVELQREHALLLKQQEMLLHCMSHDLRTPAMTILGFADLLLTDSGNAVDTHSTRQYLEHVRNSANRQVTMIGALIKLSSLNHKDLEQTPVNLTSVALTCLRKRTDAPNLAGTQLDFQTTPEAYGDAELLHQLMEVLLDNAIKFTRKISAPAIRFGAEGDAAAPVYFLQDNGAGLNMERQDRLFKPFSRVHSSKDFEGIGMGLATAQLIVQRHGGRIWVESQPDHGSIFRFTLR